MSRFWTIFIRSLLWLGLAGGLVSCRRADTATALPTPVVMAVKPTAASPTPVPTTAPLSGAWVVVQPDSTPADAQAWAAETRAWAEDAGLRWVTVPDLDAAAAQMPVTALVALPPTPWADAQGWAVAHPEARVLAWVLEAGAIPDPAGLPPNLTLMVREPLTWEQRFFLAGYTTALAAPHWRAGLLYTSPPGYAALTLAGDFNRGATYWCGPCVPAHPPMLSYPFAVEVPPGVEDAASWQEAARNLLAQAPMEAVYVRGPVPDPALDVFRQRNVRILWDGSPNPKADVSVYFDPWAPLDADWAAAWLQGEGESVMYARWRLDSADPAVFSPGRARQVERMVALLRAGRVSPESLLEP